MSEGRFWRDLSEDPFVLLPLSLLVFAISIGFALVFYWGARGLNDGRSDEANCALMCGAGGVKSLKHEVLQQGQINPGSTPNVPTVIKPNCICRDEMK